MLPEPLTLKAYDAKINYFWPISTYNIPDALTKNKFFSRLKVSKDVDLQSHTTATPPALYPTATPLVSPIADTPTGVIRNQRACAWADHIISTLTNRVNANAEIDEVYYDNGLTDREEWITIDSSASIDDADQLAGGDVVEVESEVQYFDPLDSPLN